jgi:ABC-type branched-subunit amino acid transport system substrate-binding protein
VLVEAIAEGGRLPSDVWKGMRGIHGYQGATGVIQFDEKGDVGKFPRTYVVDNGRLADYDRALEEKRDEILRRIEELNRSRGRAAAADAEGQ